MQRILLPGTGLQTSRLGFGTASLHHAVRTRDRQAILGAALDAGFTHFDTARMYGDGMAERELGRLLKGRRGQVTLGTKFGLPAVRAFEALPPLLYAHRALGKFGRRVLPHHWDHRPRLISPEAAEQSLVRSLRALQTGWVDLLFLHEPQASEVVSVLRLAEWLQRQKTNGRVRYLGLAGNAASCVEVARQIPGVFDVLQVEDSVAGHEANRVTAAGWPLQITFGYVRQTTKSSSTDALLVLRQALDRNPNGMVLVSTRRPERLPALAALAATTR